MRPLHKSMRQSLELIFALVRVSLGDRRGFRLHVAGGLLERLSARLGRTICASMPGPGSPLELWCLSRSSSACASRPPNLNHCAPLWLSFNLSSPAGELTAILADSFSSTAIPFASQATRSCTLPRALLLAHTCALGQHVGIPSDGTWQYLGGPPELSCGPGPKSRYGTRSSLHPTSRALSWRSVPPRMSQAVHTSSTEGLRPNGRHAPKGHA